MAHGFRNRTACGWLFAASALLISIAPSVAAAQPAPGNQIAVQDGLPFPRTRDAWRQMPAPAATVARDGAPSALPEGAALDVGALRFTDGEGRLMTAVSYFDRENVDGFIVLHRGHVVFERYFGAMRAEDAHLWQSMTTSLVGAVAETLAAEGKLDLARTAGSYAPEIAETVWGKATLRHLLDMELNVEEQSALAPQASVGVSDIKFLAGLLDSAVRQSGDNGKVWYYTNRAPQAVSLAMSRATGKRLAELARDIVWSKIGAEADASLWVDGDGQGAAAGGFSSTLRDAARFADMIGAGGRVGDAQAIPASVVEALRKSKGNSGVTKRGNVAMLVQRPEMSYKSYWYQVNDRTGAIEGLGMAGQHIYVNPSDRITIVQFGSYANPGVSPMNWSRLTEAIVNKLTESASARR